MVPANRQPTNLPAWLRWQQALHPQEIDLGLARVAAVANNMGLVRPNCPVITVAGTNGKGSCVAYLASILRQAGYRVGVYTSPHLLRYNERISIAGELVEDHALCAAFSQVEVARAETSLSFFEFGTLAAFYLFAAAKLDCILLEVGLGGRLDAVNLIDPDVALITSIAIDHEQWLGSDCETIAKEKAGIFRPQRPIVCALAEPPQSLLAAAKTLAAPIYQVGQAYNFDVTAQSWDWHSRTRSLQGLSKPALLGKHQIANAAAVLMALALLSDRLPVAAQDFSPALSQVKLPGRFQRIAKTPDIFLDCAHNPQAASAVAEILASLPCEGQTHIVLAMMADKDVHGVISALEGQADMWYMNSLDEERAATASDLACQHNGPSLCFASVAEGLAAALAQAKATDRILVIGSFYALEAVLRSIG